MKEHVSVAPAAAATENDLSTESAPAILMLAPLEEGAMHWLQARHSVAVRTSLAHDADALHAELAQVQALVVPANVKVDRSLLAAAPCLRVVARLGGGLENTDFEACNRRRLRVVHAATSVARSQAEYYLAGLLLLMRAGLGVRALGGGAALEADAVRVQRLRGLGREVEGATIGLLGVSAAVHALAPMLSGLGVSLIGYDPALHATSELWARLNIRRLTMAAMLETADAVVCSIPFASRYRGLLSERRLAACKPGQVWVCTTSARIFDALALADALRAREIGAAMLDNCPAEFLEPGAVLDGLPNLIVTDGAAVNSREAFLRESWFLLDRIHEALQLPALLFESPRSSAPVALADLLAKAAAPAAR